MINASVVRKLAKLSNVHLNDDEIPALIEHISQVLAYASRVEEIAAMPQADVPTAYGLTMRDDQVVASHPTILLEQVPECAQDFIVVPRILEG